MSMPPTEPRETAESEASQPELSEPTPSEPTQSEQQSSIVVPRADRYAAAVLAGVHPTLLPPETLLGQCDLRTQKRSGPGGQHRNKTSSGAFLTHSATGIVGAATERRSQADNRTIALQRLRLKLAVERRTLSILDGPTPELDQQFRNELRRTKLRLADTNPNKAAALALLLNDLHACGGQPRRIIDSWKSSSTAILMLLKSHPAAFQMLQSIRQHHGLRPLS